MNSMIGGAGLRIVWGCVVLAAIGGLAMLVRHFYGYTMDDSFITFRYAENLRVGNGLVFNPGEWPRAEGITSPIYACLIALLMLIGVPAVPGAKVLGIASLVAAGSMVGLISRKLLRDVGGFGHATAALGGFLAGAYFLLNPLAVANGVSGMETAPGVAAFAAFLMAVQSSCAPGRSSRYDGVLVGLTAVIVPMFRPEMALAVGVVMLVLLVAERSARPTMLLAVAIFVGVGACYFVVRYLYYGLALPLPFYVKQGDASFPGSGQVTKYVRTFALLCVLASTAVVAALWRSNRSEPRSRLFVLAVSVAVIVQLGYYVTIFHVMGFGQRFFQPISAALTVVGVAGFAFMIRSVARWPSLAVGAVAIVATAAFFGHVEIWRSKDADRIRTYGPLESRVMDVGVAIGKASRSTQVSIALNDCGAIPFYSGARIIDLAGLNNRNIARSRSTAAVRDEIASQRPDLIFLVAREAGNASSLHGWERIDAADVTALGYREAGSITIGPEYHYLVYMSSSAAALGVVSGLRDEGYFDVTGFRS